MQTADELKTLIVSPAAVVVGLDANGSDDDDDNGNGD